MEKRQNLSTTDQPSQLQAGMVWRHSVKGDLLDTNGNSLSRTPFGMIGLVGTNCFDFATQLGHLQDFCTGYCSVDRPEDHNMIRKPLEEWVKYVTKFSPYFEVIQRGSPADRNQQLAMWQGASKPKHQFRKVLCFPFTAEAHDYHWVVKVKNSMGTSHYFEQAGQGGDLILWNDFALMLEDIFSRKNKDGLNLYNEAFWFECRVPDNIVNCYN